MRDTYSDIIGRICEHPTWYDENGCPRYGEFSPNNCPDIYANTVVLLRIRCQDCSEPFLVELSYGVFSSIDRYPPKKLHYGDPPAHGCVGDTMNCEDEAVVEVWHRDIRMDGEFHRVPELEGKIE